MYRHRVLPLKSIVKFLVISLCVLLAINVYSTTGLEDSTHSVDRGRTSLESGKLKLSRTRRSPFIMAFQVTRPPGLFQFSMRKPVIMGVLSNMTSMILGSELARMFSRGFTGQQVLFSLNATTTGAGPITGR